MYLRNKGTINKPKWQVVESSRIDGKTSRQKVICTFGNIKNPAEVIKRWKLILDNARTAERRHWDINFRNKKFPLLKHYARRMSFDEIKTRFDKIIETAEILKWQEKWTSSKKQLKIKKERGIQDDANRALEFSLKLTDLASTIYRILAYDKLKNWPLEHRERMKGRLADIINFYHRL
ncbi:MAG TPA: hypothetical protein VHY30_04070 [Verrucomicrobiae bacterium]|jgi:hypothetical protein|nr:hypothetical protein [Verrucomicrobiae bacterium]